MAPRKERYQSKTVRFQGKELQLFSLDGFTWSSRKDELEIIKERQENARVSFEEIRTGVITKKEKPEGEEEDIYSDQEADDMLDEPIPAIEKKKTAIKVNKVKKQVKVKEAPAQKKQVAKPIKLKTKSKSEPTKKQPAAPKKRVTSKKKPPAKAKKGRGSKAA